MIILRDDFTGSGNLSDHTPNTPMFGSGWTDLSGGDAPYFVPFGLGSDEARPSTEGVGGYGPGSPARYSFAWTGKPLGSSISGSPAKQSVALEVGLYHKHTQFGDLQPFAQATLLVPFTGAASSAPTATGLTPSSYLYPSAIEGLYLQDTPDPNDGIFLQVFRNPGGEFSPFVDVVFGTRVGGVETLLFAARRRLNYGGYSTLFDGDADLGAAIFDAGVHTFRVEFSSSAQSVAVDGLTVWTGGSDYSSLTRSVRGLAMLHSVSEYHLTGGEGGGRYAGISYVQVEASGITVPDFWTAFRGAHEVLEAP